MLPGKTGFTLSGNRCICAQAGEYALSLSDEVNTYQDINPSQIVFIQSFVNDLIDTCVTSSSCGAAATAYYAASGIKYAEQIKIAAAYQKTFTAFNETMQCGLTSDMCELCAFRPGSGNQSFFHSGAPVLQVFMVAPCPMVCQFVKQPVQKAT